MKTIQEVITLVIFCIFSVVYLKEELKWNYLVGFSMIIGATFFIFKKWGWLGSTFPSSPLFPLTMLSECGLSDVSKNHDKYLYGKPCGRK